MEKELMSQAIIVFDMVAKNKEEVISQMSCLMGADGRLLDLNGYEQDVLKREGQASTCVGFLTATPHAKSNHVKCPSLAFARLSEPICWDCEEEEVSLVFQVAVPAEGQGDRHLEILAGLFRKLIYDDFREELLNADTKETVLGLIGEL
ncbi:MAG: PTS sugar transporter subunit IIA [Lacrimispora sp.]|uniref:PTS sugar transporter subunit IIA n=1 Tax=Lacrimispora sp. TaxID=2719234 RepID=UPI0039E3C015